MVWYFGVCKTTFYSLIRVEVACSVEKLSKTCVLRITAEKIHFIVSSLEDSSVQVWCHVETNEVLEDLRLESLNQNEIWLEINTAVVAKAFKSAGMNSVETTIRLTKVGQAPALALEMLNGKEGHRLPVLQEIPVVVLNRETVSRYQEPMVPDPDVHIVMPSIHHVKTIVDRMIKMGGGGTVSVSANWNGEIKLRYSNDYVELETKFNELVNPEHELEPDRDARQFAGAHVDVRDLGRFLQSEIINPSSVVCCVIENRALVFYVYVGSALSTNHAEEQVLGALTYYVPSKNV